RVSLWLREGGEGIGHLRAQAGALDGPPRCPWRKTSKVTSDGVYDRRPGAHRAGRTVFHLPLLPGETSSFAFLRRAGRWRHQQGVRAVEADQQLPDEGFSGGLGPERLLRTGQELQNQPSEIAGGSQRRCDYSEPQPVCTDA